MIDFTKSVQTRDGRKVRILCADAKGEYPIIGLIEEGGRECLETWQANGANEDPSPSVRDLINAPERVDRWINAYGPHEIIGILNITREACHEDARRNCNRALIRITYEDGKPVAVALEDCK